MVGPGPDWWVPYVFCGLLPALYVVALGLSFRAAVRHQKERHTTLRRPGRKGRDD